jgi:FAD/FMN-containing dehydrogenase
MEVCQGSPDQWGEPFWGVNALPGGAAPSAVRMAEGRGMMAEHQPLIHFTPNQVWTNTHRNVSTHVDRLYEAWNRWSDGSRPDHDAWQPGLRALQHIVREAEAAGKRVRALGGGWSLSEAAVTSDFLVDTKQLNNLVIGLAPAFLDARFQGDPRHLAFAQCGVSVMELNTALAARHLALSTSGASNGQTIGGAIATGTHGAAHAFGAMPDFVVGLHIVAEGGRHYWIERASQPVVGPAFAEVLGAELLRDTPLFEAALVSVGSFGLIHAVLLVCEPIYTLELHIRRYDYDQVKPALSTLDVRPLHLPDGPTVPFHFEAVLNPYRTHAGEAGAFVRFIYKRPFTPVPAVPGDTVVTSPGDDVMGLIGTLSDAVPHLIPAALDTFLPQQFTPTRDPIRGSHGQIFGATEVRGHAMSTEIGVALQDAGAATEAIVAIAHDYAFASPVAVRYVKASSATLAFTRFAPITCTIELPAVGSPRTQEAYRRIWAELDRRGIPYTLHWGQCLRAEAAFIRQAFGARVDAWLAARRQFLSPAARRTFANDLLVACGLAD